MRQQSPACRLVAAAAICLASSPIATSAAAAGNAGVPAYETAVPRAWQPLVSRQSYDDTLAELSALNRRLPGRTALNAEDAVKAAASPCNASIRYLAQQYLTNPKVPSALKAVAAGVKDLPPAYGKKPGQRAAPNPWRSSSNAELLVKMLVFFPKWCTSLPQINGSFDDGLNEIQTVSWLFYHNIAGQDFVQGRNPNHPGERLEAGEKFTKDFTLQLRVFMDSPASATYIAQWVDDPAIEIGDYRKQRAGDYATWNAFFARELITDAAAETIPSRPVTMPERDYVVVAPTDCIMNSLVQVIAADGRQRRTLLDSALAYNTVLDVKGIPLSVDQLLAGVEERYRSPFIGGAGQSCVLMPNTYHHFHAPVDGTVVHASIVKANTFGYYDWPNWVPPDGNVGRPGSDFSQFQAYQRGIVIIEVKYKNLGDVVTTGYVAVIPVGLETVGSVVLHEGIRPGVKVRKGYTELGNFFYGGSLNILLYSRGLASGVTQVRMGNQINLLQLGQPLP